MKVIKFYSPTCGPCKVVEKLLNDNNIEHRSIELNGNSNNKIAFCYGVRSVPTVVVLNDDNTIVKKFRGIFNINELKELL